MRILLLLFEITLCDNIIKSFIKNISNTDVKKEVDKRLNL